MHQLRIESPGGQAFPAARADRAALRVRARGPAAKRQSRQDKQRRKAEELRQAQQVARPAGDSRPGGALQWLNLQVPQSDVEYCLRLETDAASGYITDLLCLKVLSKAFYADSVIQSAGKRFRALRKPAYQQSIAQYQARPSSGLVPPAQQGVFDCLKTVVQELLLDYSGPAAADFSEYHSILTEVWQPVLEQLRRAAFCNRFNTAGRVRGTGRYLEVEEAEVELSIKHIVRSGLRDTVNALARRAGVELVKAEEEERQSRQGSAAANQGDAASQDQEEPELQRRPEVSAELRRQQEAKRAQRRAERAIRAAEAQARQVKAAEAARRKAAFRVQALRRLQAAAEHKAEEEELQAQERAERQQRAAVRHAQEYARTHTKLSARQRRLLETVREEAAEYNASREGLSCLYTTAVM